MIFSESGWKAEVALIAAECDETGVKMTFRIIETILRPPRTDNEAAIPQNGETFTAYKSHDSTSIAGWSVSGE
jgi:hypothetical protein